MKEQIALTNEYGEIEEWFSPATAEAFIEGAPTAGGLIIRKLENDVNINEFRKTNIWSEDGWITREWKNSTFWDWKGEWVYNKEKFDGEVRQRRNSLLFISDWTQTVDAPLTEEQKEAWKLYRQQLRDFMEINEATELEDIVWPVQP